MHPIFIIGISGGSATGKTTLAKRLAHALPGSPLVLSLDSYYRGLNGIKPQPPNFDHPDSLDFDLFASHLSQLKQGKAVQVPIYDFKSHTRKGYGSCVASKFFVIAEGLYLFNVPQLNALFDYKVYLEASQEERLSRRLERDAEHRGRNQESVKEQFFKEVLPMHQKFVLPNAQLADQIFSTDPLTEKDWCKLLKSIEEILPHTQ